MIESGGRLRLADEAFPGLLVAGELPGKKLERYRAAQLRVLGLVDHTHPAPAELLDYSVMRDRFADHSDYVSEFKSLYLLYTNRDMK